MKTNRSRPTSSFTLSSDLLESLNNVSANLGKPSSQIVEAALRQHLADIEDYRLSIHFLENGRYSIHLDRKDRLLYGFRGVAQGVSEPIKIFIELYSRTGFDQDWWARSLTLLASQHKSGKHPVILPIFEEKIGLKDNEKKIRIEGSVLTPDEIYSYLMNAVNIVTTLPITKYSQVASRRCVRCGNGLDSVLGHTDGQKVTWVWSCFLKHNNNYGDPATSFGFE